MRNSSLQFEALGPTPLARRIQPVHRNSRLLRIIPGFAYLAAPDERQVWTWMGIFPIIIIGHLEAIELDAVAKPSKALPDRCCASEN